MVSLLIADDEAASRNGLRRCIDWTSLGIEICAVAANGQQALEQYKRLRPDIVLTDIRMPFMDGVQLSARLRQENAKTRIIFLTGYDEVEYLHSAIHYEVSEYMLKPVDTGTLYALMERLSKGIEAEREQRNEAELMRRQIEDPAHAREIAGDSSFRNTMLSHVRTYVEQNLNGKVTVQDIADACGYSPAYIAEFYKRCTGKTLNEYVTERRMIRAKALLDQSAMRVYEVSEQVGYRDVKYFSRLFRKYYGELPKERRNK